MPRAEDLQQYQNITELGIDLEIHLAVILNLDLNMSDLESLYDRRIVGY